MSSLQMAFNQLNAFFDHIYVISLHRATDRHEHIKKELEGLQYTIFFGKDKNEFDVNELIKKNIYNEQLAIKNHRYNKTMSPGMIACSWSHRLVYEDMVEKNYEKVLIMEDDVVIDLEKISLLSGMLSSMPKDWDLFYLGFALNEPPSKMAFQKKAFYHVARFFDLINLSHKEISNRFPKKITTTIYKAGNHDCTHAYAITASCAKKLIALQTPISFWPDHLLAYVSTNEIVKSYLVMPQIINQQYQVSGVPTHSYLNQ